MMWNWRVKINKRQKLRLAQLIYKCLVPNRRHMARTFPHLNASKHANGWKIRWKNKTIVTSKSWSKFDGVEEAFVVGAGPSMNDQVLSRLQTKPCLLMNGAVSLVHLGVVKDPLAIVVEDARHMHTNAEAFTQIPQSIPLVLSLEAIHAFLYFAGAHALDGRTLYVLDNLEKPHGQGRKQLSEYESATFAEVSQRIGFSTDLDCGFFVCGTVMYAGIQVAHQLGARNLYLVGFDMSDLPRFYDEKAGGAWTGLEKGLGKVIGAIQLAQDLFAIRKGKIYNCSPSSNIPRDILPYTNILEPTGR